MNGSISYLKPYATNFKNQNKFTTIPGGQLGADRTYLQYVHNKVENKQKARGKNKPIQQQTFDYTVWICGGHPHLHQLVKVMAHWSCNKKPATGNI